MLVPVHSDTIVALATPPGQGAIAIVRISGTKAIDICNRVFPAKDLSQQAGHTIHFGTIRDGKQVVDEVLISLFKAPNSYTKENLVEISCHGSNYIVQQIIQVLLGQGARLAKPGEFTQRAFLNGQFDLAQAEAVADLIASDSQASHQTAINQMRGGFSKEIRELRESLIHFASMIELELDFSEEDVEFASRTELKTLVEKIQQVIRPMMDSFKLGNAMKTGVPIVIAGKPNAGKSTLLNALLNEEKAIVSDIPGTTRDFIEDEITIEGIKFRFIDTAGLRETEDTIEALGVQRTREQLKKAAVVVYMVDLAGNEIGDIKKELTEVREQLGKQQEQQQEHTGNGQEQEQPSSASAYAEWLRHSKKDSGAKQPTSAGEDIEDSAGRHTGSHTHSHTHTPTLFVGNKSDKVSAEFADSLKDQHIIVLSALNKSNLDELKTRILEAVNLGPVGKDQTLVTSLRHYQSLQETNNALNDVLRGIDQQVTNDFLALDIRTALHHLGEITGEITTEDLLENIFSKFCIGK